MASFLQRNKASNPNNTCSFGAGTTAGSFIIVGIFYDAAATLTSVTDGGDASTTIVAPTSDGAGTNYTCVAFLSAAAGRTTVTANFTGSPAYYDIYIWEGAGLSSPIGDKSAFATGTGLNADSGSTGTLSAAVELAIAFGGESMTYQAAGSGWSNPSFSGNGGIGEEQVTAATTALHGTATTQGTGDTWAILCATFMASGILFDAASNSGYQTAQSTYSWSHTCTGSDRYLTVGISMLSVGGSSVAGITYNGVALSLIDAKASVSGAIRAEMWGLVAPSTGSNTIAVTLSASLDSIGGAVSFTGVHQTFSTESAADASATNVGAADATVNVVTVADNDWTVDVVATSDTAITVGAGQTQRNNVTGTLGSGAMSTEGSKTPAGTVTMSWTNVAALATWSIVSVALRPVAAAGASIPINQNWPLPVLPSRMPQSWTSSYNLNLIGKDAMAPGRQSFDLARRFPPTSWPQTWTSFYNLNLIGKDALPVGEMVTPLPASRDFTVSLRTWTLSPAPYTTVTTNPFAQYNWPIPVASARLSQSWAQSSPFWAVKPFSQGDWPLPETAVSIPYGWAASYNLNLIGQDFLPPGDVSAALARDGIPLTSWIRTWVSTFNLNLIGQDQLPTRQQDWPLPIAPFRAQQSWTQVSPFWVVKPFGQTDWPLPIPPYRAPQSWAASYNLNLIGQDTTLAGAAVYALPPQPGYPPSLRTWAASATLLATPLPYPFNQMDWPVPMANPRLPQGWAAGYNPNLIGQDAMAPGDQSFDLARGIPLTSWIRTWTWYALPIPYLPPNPYPLNQYDWPLPGMPRPAQQLRTWAQSFPLSLIGQDAMAIGRTHDRLADRGAPPPIPSWTQWYPLSLIGQDALPIRQRDWPLPIARPFFQQAPVSFLVSSVVVRPFAQYDWPLPGAPRYPANLRTAIGLTAQQLGPITVPVGGSSYDLAPRAVYPAALRSYILPLGPLVFPAAPVPFHQTEWPLPKPPLYMVQLRTWVDPIKLNLLGKDTRFFVYDRPLPRRHPEPDHSFAYSRFPGLIPTTNFAICAHTQVAAYEASTRVSSATSTTKFLSC